MFFQIVRFGLSFILLASAYLKISDTATILSGDSVLANADLLPLVIGAEIFFAIVIASSPRSLAYTIAICVFFVLTSVAIWAFFIGIDCGCFRNNTPNALPLTIDVLALGSLCYCKRIEKPIRQSEDTTLSPKFFLLLCVCVATSVTVGILARLHIH